MLSGQGRDLRDLLEAAGLARSTYYYACAHPPRATSPELQGKVVEVFTRTANDCGHRQIAMALRDEESAAIADKTVLKMMHEMAELRDLTRIRLPQVQFILERLARDALERSRMGWIQNSGFKPVFDLVVHGLFPPSVKRQQSL